MILRPLQDSEWGERVLILMHKEMLTQMRRFFSYVDEHKHTHTHSGNNLSTAGKLDANYYYYFNMCWILYEYTFHTSSVPGQ